MKKLCADHSGRRFKSRAGFRHGTLNHVLTVSTLEIRAEGSPESLPLFYRLLEHDERIVTATRWHMRSDLLAG